MTSDDYFFIPTYSDHANLINIVILIKLNSFPLSFLNLTLLVFKSF